jgi:hypothetical protein
VPDSRNIAKRRVRVADALQLIDEILVIGAGELVPLPGGSDQTYPFRARLEYFYLTGVDSPGSAGLGFQNLAQFSHMLGCPDPAKMGRRVAKRLLKRSGEMAVA